MSAALGIRLRRIAVAFAGLFATCVLAQEDPVPGYPPTIDGYDAREVAMLPGFCMYTQVFRQRVPGGNNMQAIENWRAFMGPTFEAMHHYCWGLMKTNRANLLVRSGRWRQFYLADAIGEFDFVLARAPEDFILLPEILTKKGENFVKLGKGPAGVVMFERAMELKVDYWPPYAQLADYYKDVGHVRKARETITRGLSLMPDEQALKRRLVELDQPSAKVSSRNSHSPPPAGER